MAKKSKAVPASPSKAPLPASPDISATPQKTQPLPHTEDEESRDDSEESDDETDGIDEKGMKRLMELLGDDALDEPSAAQLDALKGADDISEDSSTPEDGNNASGSEAEREDVIGDGASEGSEALSSSNDNDGGDAEEHADSEDEKMASAENEAEEKDEEEIALDDRDDISIDEDAVPKQKVIIDNKVRCCDCSFGSITCSFTIQVALRRIRETIKLDPSFSWVETLAVTYPEPLGVTDPDNDLERELALCVHPRHSTNQLSVS
jgi:rRNA-processing protein EBP2